MSQITYQNSSAPELIEFARQNGVDLPEDTSKQDAWKAVKNILADFNELPADTPEELPADTPEEQPATPASVVKGKQPTHYTIQVSRPTDVKLQDFVICANGTNYQIHFGKTVKVPAVVLNILKDAVERKPAYRDMETNEWIPETFEPRYSYSVHEEHFE